MKHKLLLSLVIAMFAFLQKTGAQLPEVSTAEKPLWYYIQVVGEGASREDRVFVAKGDYLYGEALNTTSDAQLFRFEKSGDNYFIISKSTGKKVDVAMNDNEEALALTQAGIGFTIDPQGSYHNITATSTPAGGDATKKWAHQSNNNSSYKIILVNTSWWNTENSQFAFVPYESVSLEYSTSEFAVWYAVHTAKKGFEDMCLADVSAGNASDTPVELAAKEDDNDLQLWKLEENGDLIYLINKATGNLIQTESNVFAENTKYNFILLTPDKENSNWTLTHIREGQYVISGVEKDNITRYLNAASPENVQEEYNSGALFNTGFAWTFDKISSGSEVGIPTTVEDNNIYVYSQNRKIYVEDTDNYTIRTIQGLPVDKNAELTIGVYMVTVGGKTVKILVK